MSIASWPPAPLAEAQRALHARLVTSGGELLQLQAQWERLWALAPQATPFQSPRWLLPWWKHIGRGALATVAVRSGAGELVGLAPLYIHADKNTGRRHLFPLGIATTDVLEPLLAPGWEALVATSMFEALVQHAAQWDLLEWPQLRADCALLRSPVPPGWRREVIPGEPSPALRLDDARAGGHLPIRPAMAHNIRTARARAARAGQLVCERADATSIPRLLEVLARLHERRWNERGLPGVLGDASVRSTHAEAAPALQAAGLLRLYALRLDETYIAAVYALADPVPGHERRWYSYIGGFDPAHGALSPGALLLAHVIGEAADEGATAFDFLRGAEAYKYRWGAVDQPMFTLRLQR